MTAAKTDRFPGQIRFIVGNEACERFSFYGMRSILVVFMVGHLLMAKSESTALYHYFVSACYLFPLLGAWIADRFWGKYKNRQKDQGEKPHHLTVFIVQQGGYAQKGGDKKRRPGGKYHRDPSRSAQRVDDVGESVK